MSNDTPMTMERLQHLSYAASVSACMKPEFLKGLAETHPSALIRALATELATLREKLAEAESAPKYATSDELASMTRDRNSVLQSLDAMHERAQQAEQRAEAAEKDAERYRKCRRNGGFYFTGDGMSDEQIDEKIDALPEAIYSGWGAK